MTRTTRHLVLRAALTLLLGLLAIALPVTTASAHSTLIAISPKDGATVTTPPTRVVLTFNEDVNQQFSLIRVVDSSGADVTSGATAVNGAVVSRALQPGLPPGTYTVTFKVVSSDGHPISQKSTFTIAGASSSASPSTSSTSASVAPTMTPLDQGTPAAAGGTEVAAPSSGSPESSGSSGSAWPWLAGGAVLVAAVGGGAWALRRRGRSA